MLFKLTKKSNKISNENCYCSIRNKENRMYISVEFTRKKCKTAILLCCFHTAGVLHIFMLDNLLGPGISFYRKYREILLIPLYIFFSLWLFQRCTHVLYCSVLSLGGKVNTRRMSKPDMGSIFDIK